MLVEPVGCFKTNLEFEWLNSYITGKLWGFFYQGRGKKVTQTKTGHIFLFPLSFRRCFNIKIAFGEGGHRRLAQDHPFHPYGKS